MAPQVEIGVQKEDFSAMEKQIPFAFDVLSVSELTGEIKILLESNFTDVLVEGELSNVKESRNGHIYFTVKDDNAQLPCVVWRSTAQRLGLELSDGQQVVLGGDIQVYPPHGRYQMIVSLVQQAGVGKLQQKFEELKQQLQDEGLFDEKHKKPLPAFPFKIGIITSATGAAFQDIRSTFEQRWPVAELFLHHASVQGLNAAAELVRAIDYFSARKDPVDLLIIGRGGGSLEDLWPFNEETVARAIFTCPIPVISAVGHEVDFSISDFTADARAATPTQAVIIATPDIHEMRYQIEDYTRALSSNLHQKIQYYREYVYRLAHSHALLVVRQKLEQHRERITALDEKLTYRLQKKIMKKKDALGRLDSELKKRAPAAAVQHGLDHLQTLNERLRYRYERILSVKKTLLKEKTALLEELNPGAPLERGFTRILQNGVWIREKASYSKQEEIEIEWKDGRIVIR